MAKMRVLIIDDEKQLRIMLRHILEKAGFETGVASDGYDGLRLFREQDFDLVVVDILMLGQGGLSTIVKLREINPLVRILAISGGGGSTTGAALEMAKKLGAMSTLAKPFHSEQLLESVRVVLSKVHDLALGKEGAR